MQVAEKAAREAGKLLRENIGKVTNIEYKAKNSLVTEVDYSSETLIIDVIRSSFPEHSILAEESGRHNASSSHVWIIDPLDGTTNYAHAYPVFAISIALEIDNIVQLGIVYDPMREEFFSAELGRGALMNDQPIKVSDTETLEQSLLCTGFTHHNEWMVDENLRHFENVIRKSRGVRRDGSAALDLCYVACGRYDGFWELGLNPWDTAAGALIVEEAGGLVTDFLKGDFSINSEYILATNELIHDEMINVLSSGKGN